MVYVYPEPPKDFDDRERSTPPGYTSKYSSKDTLHPIPVLSVGWRKA